MVVVDEVLAITAEQLQVALEEALQREGPVDGGRAAAVVAEAQRVAQRERQHMAVTLPDPEDLATADVVEDVAVVVAGEFFGDAVPGLDQQCEVLALEAELRVDAFQLRE